MITQFHLKKRQIVLHWGYELNKKRFAIILSHWRFYLFIFLLYIRWVIINLTGQRYCKKQKAKKKKKKNLTKKLLNVIYWTKNMSCDEHAKHVKNWDKKIYKKFKWL